MAPTAVHSKPYVYVSLLLIGLAWTLPFLQPYHRFPLTSFHSEWLAFALGLAAAVPLLRAGPWRAGTVPMVALAPLALAALIAAQAALGRVPYAEQALVAALYLLWSALLILLGHALRRELPLDLIAATLAWFLIAGGLVNGLIGLIQHYSLSGPFDFLVARKDGPVIYGNLGQANHYAASISLALASTAYLYGRRALHATLAAACATLFLVVLALAGSRSSWLYLGAFVAVALLLHRLRHDEVSRRIAVLTLWLLPGFIVAQWLVTLPPLVPAAGSAMATSGQRLFEVASGIGTRLQLWGEAWRMFLAAPVLGAGFGQFAWHHFAYQAAGGALTTPRVFNHAHNIVLQLMAETGAVGAAVVVSAAAVWLADLRRAKLEVEHGWLLALLAVLGIHSLLEYPLWYAYFLGVAALLLGLGAQRAFPVRFAGPARALVGLALLAGAVNLVAVIGPYRDFERLVFDAGAKADRPAGDEAFARAMMRVHREPLLTPYVELAFALGATVDESAVREKLELNTRAMRFAPVEAVVYRQALLLASAGEREAALAQLAHALRVYPGAARAIATELETLARRRPAEFTPLLKLATASIEEGSAPRALR